MAARKNTGSAGATDETETITDPVEWANHYWSKFDLGTHQEAFLAMSSTLRLHRLMTDTVETALRAYSLNLTDYLVLMTLELSDNGTRLLSRLAWNLLVHATTITLATDRLEGRGLLYRHPHPTDRRATCVTITDEGRELTRKATDALREVKFGLTGSTLAQQQRLLAVLGALRSAAGDIDRAH
ncbi:MarR family winged helix-turn-helix transcriptional regulator [Prauserella oleivorans]|uniref:MarR family winged helix-turn-helix transcriptional regulator n=1 Tax=Prauserella oleivorans TaxID=1478153 RepID=A0ABW5W2X6_9PSEU